jgi:hypothetical protein
MNKESTTSGAALTAPDAPRAFQLVARKGVVTSQLRDGKGRFGGRVPRQDLNQLEDAVQRAEQDAMRVSIADMRTEANRLAVRRERLNRIIAIATVALSAFIVLYMIGQFLR